MAVLESLDSHKALDPLYLDICIVLEQNLAWWSAIKIIGILIFAMDVKIITMMELLYVNVSLKYTVTY